jgi:hypothetical protein
MNKGRVGEERGGKETDGCPLTLPLLQKCCQGTLAAYPPVTGQGRLNGCGSAKAG